MKGATNLLFPEGAHIEPGSDAGFDFRGHK
jgi:hypothetical protein